MEIFLKYRFLAIAAAVLFVGVSLPLAAEAVVTTCGAGSNVTFTSIGGGQCRAFLTSGSGNITIPTNWDSSHNSVETIGPGGSGADVSSSELTGFGGGGGGGAYAASSNLSLTPGGSVPYVVGVSGTSNTSFNTSSVVAAKGVSGSSSTNGAGGTTAASTGATKFAGGGATSGNGGGAAGPNGAGNPGASGGGSGDAGSGGAGAAAGGCPSSDGGNGTEYDATHGSGGGGGRGADSDGFTDGCAGSNGGSYGAGGGGGGGGGGKFTGLIGGAAGLGGGGLIVITYTPLTAPAISSGAATNVTAATATLNGSMSANGGVDPTTCGFAWGTDSSLSGGNTATTTDSTCPSGTGSFTKNVTVFAGTTYYFRAYATNSIGTGYGSILNFISSKKALSKPPNNLGLVGYWPMNEGTSTTAGDFSGNGSTGTLTTGGTGLPLWVVGKRGNALSFSGTNDTYVLVGNKSALNVGSTGTVSAWIKKNSSVGFAPVASKMNWSTDRNGYGIFFDSNGTKLDVDLDSGSGFQSVNSNATLSNGVWYHVAYTWDGSTVRIYINGAEDKNTPQTQTPTPSSQSFYIGSANTGDNFDGLIDEVRVYTRALTATEIAALYGNGSGSAASGGNASSKILQNGTTLGSGLVGFWTFDGSAMNWATSKAYDLSGSNLTGTLVNMTQASVAIGKLGQALSFDGSSSYVDMGSVTGPTSAVTIAAWVKKNADVPWASILDLYGNENLDCLSLGFDNSTGKKLMFMANNPAPYSGTITAATDVPDGQWVHVAASSNASTVTFYINGVSDGSAAVGAPCSSGSLFIGANFPGGDEYLNGSLDDVRLYNRALSASEILQLYKLGKVLVKP